MSTSPLFSPADLEQLAARGVSLEEAERQVHDIRAGFPFLEILASASLDRGIIRIERDEEARYMNAWEEYLQQPSARAIKMVPASGAASRMFKSLYAFLESSAEEPNTPAVEKFFDRLTDFAFYDKLSGACLRATWKTIPKLLSEHQYRTIIENLLHEKGLGYGSLPKGLLQFHHYPKYSRTPVEEHLVEGALYTRDLSGHVRILFTVSSEHRKGFEQLVEEVRPYYEDRYGVIYDISYSEQKPSTDTLALTPEGELFRREDGQILFRPGGHGALISNLNDLEADVVFIKNIDNVVPDHLKCATVMSKKLLGGILVQVREQIYRYMQSLEHGRVSHGLIEEMVSFVEQTLCINIPEDIRPHDRELIPWLMAKLDRPIRVCGMVRNQGEPGGGPFLIREADGSSSLQILESSQINMSDEHQRAYFEMGGYFNPVDLVCSLRNHRGEKYDLMKYINPKTAFLAQKSQSGRDLVALECPGLWNGAMHHWTTLFVEVPAETFSPVKEVNDLLRPEHQSK